MGGQHDHHCILTFDRVDWRIIGCTRGGRKVTVRALSAIKKVYDLAARKHVWSRDAVVITVLDLSNTDMDAYCAAAAAWDMRADAVAHERAVEDRSETICDLCNVRCSRRMNRATGKYLVTLTRACPTKEACEARLMKGYLKGIQNV